MSLCLKRLSLISFHPFIILGILNGYCVGFGDFFFGSPPHHLFVYACGVCLGFSFFPLPFFFVSFLTFYVFASVASLVAQTKMMDNDDDDVDVDGVSNWI